MSSPNSVVELSSVGKKYKLFRSPANRLSEAFGFNQNHSRHDFWALQDISFKLEKGRTLGIIGLNGSGKSTLLQLLTGITKPSSGQIRTQGRIACLLELGAGFNPEFTGRENTYLSGLMAGLTPKQIEKRMAAIESFADIGKFFDQPVRTYSSGMFVRLAFSVSVHTDPDILIIDEALAVGDALFQQKCFQKLKDFQNKGVTVIFVTHDMEAVARHSQEALLLHEGKMLSYGRPSEIISLYHELIIQNKSLHASQPAPPAIPVVARTNAIHSQESFLNNVSAEDRCSERLGYNKNEHRYGNQKAQIIDFLTVSGGKTYPSTIESGQMLDIYLKVLYQASLKEPVCGFDIKTLDGVMIYGTNSYFQKITLPTTTKTDVVFYKLSLKITLHNGDYMILVGIGERVDGKDELADSRSHFIHLKVTQPKNFDGLVDLQGSISEVNRKPADLYVEQN